jgi:hypothetical protein
MFYNRHEDVSDKILSGACNDCDQDYCKCYNQGYCEYEKKND